MRRALLLAALACAGCVNPRYRAPVAMPAALAWLQPGCTTRADLVAQFGEPKQSFEDGRIQAWDLDKQLQTATISWRRPYNLLVVFGSGGLVERASLVESR